MSPPTSSPSAFRLSPNNPITNARRLLTLLPRTINPTRENLISSDSFFSNDHRLYTSPFARTHPFTMDLAPARAPIFRERRRWTNNHTHTQTTTDPDSSQRQIASLASKQAWTCPVRGGLAGTITGDLIHRRMAMSASQLYLSSVRFLNEPSSLLLVQSAMSVDDHVEVRFRCHEQNIIF